MRKIGREDRVDGLTKRFSSFEGFDEALRSNIPRGPSAWPPWRLMDIHNRAQPNIVWNVPPLLPLKDSLLSIHNRLHDILPGGVLFSSHPNEYEDETEDGDTDAASECSTNSRESCDSGHSFNILDNGTMVEGGFPGEYWLREDDLFLSSIE